MDAIKRKEIRCEVNKTTRCRYIQTPTSFLQLILKLTLKQEKIQIILQQIREMERQEKERYRILQHLQRLGHRSKQNKERHSIKNILTLDRKISLSLIIFSY